MRISPVFIHRQVGYVLLVTVLGLISLGIIMLFSVSGKFAEEGNVSMYGMLRKQAIWLAIGAMLCTVVSRIDYHWITQKSWWWIGAAALLLMLCFVPHIGKLINGARRWLVFGSMTLQPSEIGKLALICFLAYWLGKHQRRIQQPWEGVGVPCLVAAALIGLVIREPDLGSCAIMGIILCVLLFCAGVKFRYLLPLPLLGLGGLFVVAISMPERLARMTAWLNPVKSASGKGYQVWQALIALGSGGLSGLGLGNSRQKMNFLPESTTDFIFPIVGEELGMWIALGVVFSFLILALCGGWISMNAPDPTGVLLGGGITTLIGVQALINFGVVTSILPNKGLPLPFISYGGSNLILCLVCIGILFNLHRQAIYERRDEETQLPQSDSIRI